MAARGRRGLTTDDDQNMAIAFEKNETTGRFQSDPHAIKWADDGDENRDCNTTLLD